MSLPMPTFEEALVIVGAKYVNPETLSKKVAEFLKTKKSDRLQVGTVQQEPDEDGFVTIVNRKRPSQTKDIFQLVAQASATRDRKKKRKDTSDFYSLRA